MYAPKPSTSQYLEDLRQRPLLVGAFLVVVTLFLYAAVSDHQFLDYDDSPYVTNNEHVRTGLTLSNTAWAFTTFHEANWHPLTWLSHMADCQLFGLNSGAHHLINVGLHALNALLLFLLLQRGTGAVWRSAFVAALFAVHPLNVETVAWVAERKSLLSMAFCLLTIASYGWYAARPHWKRYVLVVLAFSLALMAKPMAVSLPMVLLLIDYWPLQRYEDSPVGQRWLRLSVEKVPLLIMSAASCIVTIVAQHSGGAMTDTSIVPLSERVENAAVSYLAYIGKMFWPARLAIFYPHPEHSLPVLEVFASVAVLVAVSLAVWRLRRARYLAVGWFVFLLTLVPVIGIVQVGPQAMADRYAYIPCIGLFLIITWGLHDLTSATAIKPLAPAIAALCVLAVLTAATYRYLQYWQNGVTLLTHARAVAGRPSWMIEELLGDSLVAANRLNEAQEHYSEACLLRPNFAPCHYNLAEILFTGHQLREALDQYQIAARLTDKRDMAISCLINSGDILLQLGDPTAANAELSQALQMDPGNATALALRQQAVSRGRQDP